MAVVATLTSESIEDGSESASYTKEYSIADGGAVVTAANALASLAALFSTVTINGKTASLKARTVNAVGDGSSKVWTGKEVYSWSAQGSQNAPGSTEFVAIDLDTTETFVDVYRTGASIPGDDSAPGNVDIGGTAVDACGTAVSAGLNLQEMTITNIRGDNHASTILSYIGKRNSSTWLNGAAGTVLFQSARSRRIAVDKYEVQYKFVWDQAHHLRQLCARDVDGQPILNAPDGNGNATAKYVYARQPFPTKVDFTGMGLALS